MAATTEGEVNPKCNVSGFSPVGWTKGPPSDFYIWKENKSPSFTILRFIN